VKSLAVRLGVTAALAFVAVMILAIALWELAQALLLELQAAGLGAPLSYLITSAAGFVLAALILLATWLGSRRRRRAAPLSGIDNVAARLGGAVADEFAASTRSHPYRTIGVALMAGLMLGAIPELRGALRNLFK
jgi:hypothetical protein